MRCPVLVLLLLAACGAPPDRGTAPQPAPEPRAIFDGRSLAGWDGDPRYWSVENGALVGRSTRSNPLASTTYLVWRGGEVADFELAFDFRITGGNSGLQFRSRDLGGWRVAGYQADLEDGPNWTGCLYEQDGRGVMAGRGEDARFTSAGKSSTRFADSDALLSKVKPREWTRYVVRARGREIELEVAGERMLRVVDDDDARFAPRGLLAFQLHQGPPMQVEFRNVRLKELPTSVEIAERPKPAVERVPEWIWCRAEAGEGELAAFRRAFELRAEPVRARLRGSFDNHGLVYVNGARVLYDGEWETPADVDVLDHLRAGANEVTLAVRNESGPAGGWVELVVEGEHGRMLRLVTDASWSAIALSKDTKLSDWSPSSLDAHAAGSAHALARLGEGAWGTTGLTQAAGSSNPEPIEERAPEGDTLELPEGFHAELLYSVPKSREGSWVSLCTDDRGRLYTSDQDGNLYRVTPPRLGGDPRDTRVERVPLDLGRAHGLLWAFDALYVVVGESQPRAPGLYRLRDTDGDDELDRVDLLRELGGSGEHGPHAVLLGPDGESLWIVAGNFTKVPELTSSRVPATWGEDELLPHLDDPNGHDPHIKAPGGWICRTDRDGKEWELFAAGLRNSYDAAFGPEGELFTYDSDMEWDIGAPWYRPTRVLHVVSGADYGWRNGSAKWNADWPDTLPSVVDLGAGSPTGVLYGKELRFPEQYRRALFCADWAYGKLYCVHLSERGSSFGGTSEVFASGKPFPVTDLVAGQDGALYVTTGGRRAQSGLYRITWERDLPEREVLTPKQPSEAVPIVGQLRGVPSLESSRLPARDRRRAHAPFHLDDGGIPGGAEGSLAAIAEQGTRASLDAERIAATGDLASEDPFLRQASRLAVERLGLDPEHRSARSAPAGLIARIHREGVNARADVLAAFLATDLSSAGREARIDWLRVLQLVLVRCGPIDAESRESIAGPLSRLLATAEGVNPGQSNSREPETTSSLRRELVRVIAGLNVEAGLEPVLAELERATTQEDAIHCAHALLAQHAGWNVERRRRALTAIDAWRAKARGGHSLVKFVDAIRERMVKALTDEERAALGSLAELPGAAETETEPAATPHVRAWTRAEIEMLFRGSSSTSNGAATGSSATDPHALGRAAFTKARCATCHRIDGAGGSTGSDLTGVGRRFSRADLLESLLEPSKVISDQYRDVELITTDGELHVGRIEREDEKTITLRSLPPNEDLVELAKSDLEERRLTSLSRMPSNLLDVLTGDEVRALVRYLLER